MFPIWSVQRQVLETPKSLINKRIIHEKWLNNGFVDFAGHDHR